MSGYNNNNIGYTKYNNQDEREQVNNEESAFIYVDGCQIQTVKKENNCDIGFIGQEETIIGEELIECEKIYNELDLKHEQDERGNEAEIIWMGKNRDGKDSFQCAKCLMVFTSIPDHLEQWHSVRKENKQKSESVCVGNQIFEIVNRDEGDTFQHENEATIMDHNIEKWDEVDELIIQEDIEEDQIRDGDFKVEIEDPSQEKEFICSECNAVLTRDEAKDHQCSLVHSAPSSSGVANDTSPTEDNATDEKPTFVCAYCHKTFNSFRNLIKHDLICKKKLNIDDDDDDEEDIRPHSKKTLPPPPRQFKCPHCDEIFVSVKDLAAHSRAHNIKFDVTEYLEEEVICKICNTIFSSKKNLKLHLKMHNKVRMKTIEEALPLGADIDLEEQKHFFCEICNKSFAQKLLTVHKNMHQNIEEFSCRICNKQFENSPSYDMHMKLHADKPKYERPRRRTKAELSGMRLPFPCNYCDREFLRPHEKVKHERVHTGEKPYECEVCGKSFRVTYSLTLHLRTHTNVRPFVCAQCDKRFKSYPVYAHHLKIHSEERSYKCPYCPKSFRTAVQLCGHRNSHTKPFNCPECNRPFGTMYAVKIHMKTHSKSNKSNENLKHSCNLCGAVYARLFALRYHMKEQHGKETGENKHEKGVDPHEDENAVATLAVENDKQYNEDEISTHGVLHTEEVTSTIDVISN